MNLPSPGTLTLLFTDLVGSTEVAARVGSEDAHALRRAHDRILRSCIDRGGGSIIKNTGDGFFVAFGSARTAVQCAADILQAIEQQHAEGRYLELALRIGLHTGEPVLEDGDLFGLDVALAQRIMSEAGAGEAFASELTYLLAKNVTQVRFEHAGARPLKGFPEPVTVYRLVPADPPGAGAAHLNRLCGRTEEQAQLTRALEAALHGRGSTVLIAGEPGVGKTRLSDEVARKARDHGFNVVVGRAFETEGFAPYASFARAFSPVVRDARGDELEYLVGSDAPRLARIIPELEAHATPAVAILGANADAERLRMFDAMAAFARRLAAVAPLLLVLDDLHWADHSSIFLLQHLARLISDARILVIATYRDVEVSGPHPLADLVTELERERLGTRLLLRPLTIDESRALLADLLHEEPSSETVEAVYRVTEGNPFFTEELVRHLQSQGMSFANDEGLRRVPVPDTVRQVLLRRIERLGDETRTTLSAAAVLGRELTVARLAAMTEQDSLVVLTHLEEALDARVLREEGEEFVFAHPLIWEVTYQALSSARRRVWHRRIAAGLERLYSRDASGHLEEMAHHLIESMPEDEDAERAIRLAEAAARRALEVFAYDTAATYLARAVDLCAHTPERDLLRECELLLALGQAQVRAGDAPAADATFQRATELGRANGRPELLARGALGIGDARRIGGIIDDQLMVLLAEALAALDADDDELRARVLARYAVSLYHTESIERIAEIAAEALRMARRLEDPATLIYVLRTTHGFLYGQHDFEAKLEGARELRALAESVGDRETALYARHLELDVLVALGDMETADIEAQEFSSRAEELRQEFYLWLAEVYRAMRATMAGNFDEAEALAQAAFALGRETQSETNLPFQFLATQLFAIRLEQGRLGELASIAEEFVRQYPALRWRVSLALILLETGEEARAREEFNLLVGEDSVDIPDDFNQGMWLALLAELCARLGASEHAPVMYARLKPFEGRNISVGSPTACAGSASRYLGMLAALICDWDTAERHFSDALEMHERMAAWPLLARTQINYAEMLLARRAAGDVSRAAHLLDRADHTARALGLVRSSEEIAELRARAGVDEQPSQV